MGAMRAVCGACALALWTLLPACDEKASDPPPEDGVLVLELGGDHPSIRESLQAFGVVFEPEPEPPRPEPQPEPPPRDDPQPSPPDPELQPEFFSVQLQQGETLWDLARAHLGKGTRWTEILAINGWTEDQARRLRPGTAVRIPRQ